MTVPPWIFKILFSQNLPKYKLNVLCNMALNLQVFCSHIIYCLQLMNQGLCSKNLKRIINFSQKSSSLTSKGLTFSCRLHKHVSYNWMCACMMFSIPIFIFRCNSLNHKISVLAIFFLFQVDCVRWLTACTYPIRGNLLFLFWRQ